MTFPLNLNTKLFAGFTNKELEYICNYRHKKFQSAPWLFWPTEIYGFGHCYRKWLNWPLYLPIPVYGDHGVDLYNSFSPHEKNNKSRFHLTWNKFKASIDLPNKKVIYITNPWVTYRQIKQISKNPDSKGTIVFYSHTSVGIENENFNHEKYFNELNNLDDSFKPLVICMHMHDVKKGLHEKIRKFGFPIISIGNSSCPHFVDRFYNVIINFSRATSNRIGSQLFYCTEIGIPYFLYGHPPTLINYGDKNIPKGLVYPKNEIGIYLNEKTTKLFSNYSPIINELQKEHVKDILGLDSTITKNDLINIFIKESVRLFPYYVFDILLNIYKRIFKRNFLI